KVACRCGSGTRALEFSACTVSLGLVMMVGRSEKVSRTLPEGDQRLAVVTPVYWFGPMCTSVQEPPLVSPREIPYHWVGTAWSSPRKLPTTIPPVSLRRLIAVEAQIPPPFWPQFMIVLPEIVSPLIQIPVAIEPTAIPQLPAPMIVFPVTVP